MKTLTRKQIENLQLLFKDFKIEPLDYALIAGFVLCCIAIGYLSWSLNGGI